MARVASMTMRMLRVLDDERLERAELERLTNDRAALRQVATLVAKAAPREDIYAAVASEVAQLLDADVAAVLRYEGDGTARIVGCGAAEGCRSQWALVWRIARGLRSPSSRRADRLVSGAFTDCSVRSRTLSAASALWAVDRRRGRYLGSRVRRVVSPRSATRAESERQIRSTLAIVTPRQRSRHPRRVVGRSAGGAYATAYIRRPGVALLSALSREVASHPRCASRPQNGPVVRDPCFLARLPDARA